MSANLIVLAGPNGAGKSTFFKAHLEDKGLPFVNADNLARTLGLEAYEAANYAKEIRGLYLETHQSFIFETVFSDPVGDKLNFMARAVKKGFQVTLMYIGLDSPQQSVRRVEKRVEAGGHDVPKEKLLARYDRTLQNLKHAVPTLPRVIVYDNSDSLNPYRLIAEFRNGQCVRRATNVPDWFKIIIP